MMWHPLKCHEQIYSLLFLIILSKVIKVFHLEVGQSVLEFNDVVAQMTLSTGSLYQHHEV